MTRAERSTVPVVRVALRAVVGCTLAAVALVALRDEFRPLPDALASRGLTVVPGSVRWIDPPGLDARRALVLAHTRGEATDVYAVTARTGPGDRVVSVRTVSNLTRSPDAQEESLAVAGPWAAFATRVGDRVVAFTLLDTRGERVADVRPAWDARLRGAVTRTQQTGQREGYGVDRYELTRPARTTSLDLAAGVLTVLSDGARTRVALDGPHGPRVTDGMDGVRPRPRLEADAGSWVTWAVDTVRALPFVGPVPIAWAESVAFRTQHTIARARAATTGPRSVADTQREISADLGDVLAVRATTALEGPVTAWPPDRITGALSPSIAHEGEWSPVSSGDDDPFLGTNPGAPPPMYVTFVRTDRERPDGRVYVVAWDPRQVELHEAPGSQEPMGATGETGSGAIPRDEATMLRLVGGFNGAFQGLHGEYGLYSEGMLLLPPKPYAATVALMADGTTGFGSWPPDRRDVPDDIVEFRQNLTPLVDHGQYNPWGRYDWGAVLNGPADLRTARSGLCLTREDYVAFFWGDQISPHALGDAMIAARCTYGVHLDMNGSNTGFEFYRVARAGSMPPAGHRIDGGYEAEGIVDELPSLVFRARKLVRGMPHHAPRYIHRNPRDFFYLLLRPTLPGRALVPAVQPAQPGEGSWHVAGLGATAFPWPLARTRIRPDAQRPERWVNLVRVDARRVALSPPDAGEGVVARVVGGAVAHADSALRVSMDHGAEGWRWTIGTTGDGLRGTALGSVAAPLRGACVDGDGFLVLAVADRAMPGLVAQALDRAGCALDGPRIALDGGVLALPAGGSATGEPVPADARAVLTLTARDEAGARAIFPEVTPVARAVWEPVQSRRVRYFPNPGNNVTVQVRLAGQQQPVVLSLPGVGQQFLQQAYPDGGIPPTLPPTQ